MINIKNMLHLFIILFSLIITASIYAQNYNAYLKPKINSYGDKKIDNALYLYVKDILTRNNIKLIDDKEIANFIYSIAVKIDSDNEITVIISKHNVSTDSTMSKSISSYDIEYLEEKIEIIVKALIENDERESYEILGDKNKFSIKFGFNTVFFHSPMLGTYNKPLDLHFCLMLDFYYIQISLNALGGITQESVRNDTVLYGISVSYFFLRGQFALYSKLGYYYGEVKHSFEENDKWYSFVNKNKNIINLAIGADLFRNRIAEINLEIGAFIYFDNWKITDYDKNEISDYSIFYNKENLYSPSFYASIGFKFSLSDLFSNIQDTCYYSGNTLEVIE